MLFYFVMVGSQIKDDINSALYGVGSRASLTVIFFLRYEIEKRLKAVMVKEAVNNLVRVLRT